MANDSLAQGAPKASYLMPRVTKEKWDSLWIPDKETQEKWDSLAETLINPPKPNAALKEATKRHLPVVDRNESKSQSNALESVPKPEESDLSQP